MRKYGFDAFTFDEIDRAETYDELNSLECMWIAHYRATEPSFGYNILPGGRGKPMKAATRAQISASVLCQYAEGHEPANKGKPMSNRVRKLVSEGLKRSIRNKGHQNRMRKEIRCIETDETFPSMAAAARARRFSPAALTLHMKGSAKTCDRHHWEWTGGGRPDIYENSAAVKEVFAATSRRQSSGSKGARCPVRCVETDEVFESTTAAAARYGIDKRAIFSAMERNITAAGLHWIRLKPKQKHNARGHATREVRAKESGIVYPSLARAAKAVGLSTSTSIWCAINRNETAAGQHWEYVERLERPPGHTESMFLPPAK